MKRTVFILIVLSLVAVTATAQDRNALELSSKYDSKNNVTISARLYEKGIYTVILDFYDVENINVERLRRMEVRSDGAIAILKPIDPEKSTSFRFRYKYFPGTTNPRKVDPAFVYRLPFGGSESREVWDLYNVNEQIWGVDSESINFKSRQFIMSRADTVYAARKGTVIKVVDRHDPILGKGTVSMSTENNEVRVEHADGTIARYGVLEKGSITVEPGDTVYPHTPIGLAGTLDGEVYQARFDLRYHRDNLPKIGELDEYQVTLFFLNPVFATSEGLTQLTSGSSYTPVASDEMITAEMTKREIKVLKQQ